jgi:pectate lyase
MTISRIRGLKYFGSSITLTLVGAVLAFVLNLGADAQIQTLFSANFEDGNADGWTKSGGGWAVVSDGSRVYRQSSTSSDARARAGSITTI